jgi:hypothetical protein
MTEKFNRVRARICESYNSGTGPTMKDVGLALSRITELEAKIEEFRTALREARAGHVKNASVSNDRRLRITDLERALTHLRNEASGVLYLPGVREEIGNTNFNCLETRINEAEKLLKGDTQ